MQEAVVLICPVCLYSEQTLSHLLVRRAKMFVSR